MQPTPLYEHDCNKCVFLGSINGMDAYKCSTPHGHTYILRMSAKPEDYASQEDFHNLLWIRIRKSFMEPVTAHTLRIIDRMVIFEVFSLYMAQSMEQETIN